MSNQPGPWDAQLSAIVQSLSAVNDIVNYISGEQTQLISSQLAAISQVTSQAGQQLQSQVQSNLSAVQVQTQQLQTQQVALGQDWINAFAQNWGVNPATITPPGAGYDALVAAYVACNGNSTCIYQGLKAQGVFSQNVVQTNTTTTGGSGGGGGGCPLTTSDYGPYPSDFIPDVSRQWTGPWPNGGPGPDLFDFIVSGKLANIVGPYINLQANRPYVWIGNCSAYKYWIRVNIGDVWISKDQWINSGVSVAQYISCAMKWAVWQYSVGPPAGWTIAQYPLPCAVTNTTSVTNTVTTTQTNNNQTVLTDVAPQCCPTADVLTHVVLHSDGTWDIVYSNADSQPWLQTINADAQEIRTGYVQEQAYTLPGEDDTPPTIVDSFADIELLTPGSDSDA